jgi:hypothetical protein
MGIAASNALLGPRLLANEPKILDDITVWENGFFKMAMGLPKWMVKDAHVAREKLTRAIMKWGVDDEGMMSYLKRQNERFAARDIDRWDVAAVSFSLWTG